MRTIKINGRLIQIRLPPTYKELDCENIKLSNRLVEITSVISFLVVTAILLLFLKVMLLEVPEPCVITTVTKQYKWVFIRQTVMLDKKPPIKDSRAYIAFYIPTFTGDCG